MQLKQITGDLYNKVSRVKTDEDLATLGFECKGYLCSYKGYESFSEYNWVWQKIVGDEIYIIAATDQGNTNCRVSYFDVYIEELVNCVKKGEVNARL